eukprot:6995673-Prymnesium_polylepis.1
MPPAPARCPPPSRRHPQAGSAPQPAARRCSCHARRPSRRPRRGGRPAWPAWSASARRAQSAACRACLGRGAAAPRRAPRARSACARPMG